MPNCLSIGNIVEGAEGTANLGGGAHLAPPEGDNPRRRHQLRDGPLDGKVRRKLAKKGGKCKKKVKPSAKLAKHTLYNMNLQIPFFRRVWYGMKNLQKTLFAVCQVPTLRLSVHQWHLVRGGGEGMPGKEVPTWIASHRKEWTNEFGENEKMGQGHSWRRDFDMDKPN